MLPDVFDAILDYPTYFRVRDAFLNPKGQFSSVVSAMNSSQQTYKNGLFRTASFVENHDQPRLPSLTKDPGVRFACDFRASFM